MLLLIFLKDVASSDPKYMAYGVNMDGVWKTGHSLRMIRSGAAALLGPDGDALRAAYGKVAIYPTYSMSEQVCPSFLLNRFLLQYYVFDTYFI